MNEIDTTGSTDIFQYGYGRTITIRGTRPVTVTIPINIEQEERHRKNWEANCGLPDVDTTANAL